jgi:DnaJ-class molecular chaperone
MGGFEDMINDLFGGGFHQKTRRGAQEHQYDNSPITMNVVLNFEESVKGVRKVHINL